MEHLRYIEEAKKKAGSYKALAEILGIPQTNMSTIKSGRRPLSKGQILKLAAYLGDVTAGEIWEAQCASDTENQEERQLALNFLRQSRQLRHAAGIAVIAFVTVFCVNYPAETLATLENSSAALFIMSTLALVWVTIQMTIGSQRRAGKQRTDPNA